MTLDPRQDDEPPGPFLLNDRAAVPEPMESDSEAAWAEFERLYRLEAEEFTRAMPGAAPGDETSRGNPAGPHEWPPERSLEMPPDAAFAPTLPMPWPGGAQAAGVHTGAGAPHEPAVLTVHEAMVEVRRFNRVCPRPQAWQALYDLIPGKLTTGHAWQPPPPITGAAWQATSAVPKRMCLREQLEWAEHQGALGEAMRFLRALPEDQWHHVGDADA